MHNSYVDAVLFPKHRNAIARDLRTRKYRPRVVRNRKLYSRKGRAGQKGRDAW
jgi:hypothetical protein